MHFVLEQVVTGRMINFCAVNYSVARIKYFVTSCIKELSERIDVKKSSIFITEIHLLCAVIWFCQLIYIHLQALLLSLLNLFIVIYHFNLMFSSINVESHHRGIALAVVYMPLRNYSALQLKAASSVGRAGAVRWASVVGQWCSTAEATRRSSVALRIVAC